MEQMPTADFFARLGLFLAKDFLDADLCSSIIAESRASAWKSGKIFSSSAATGKVDENVRKTLVVRGSIEEVALVKGRLNSIKSDLERHFKVTLNGFEEPELLRYREGYFFLPHQDSTSSTDAPSQIRERRVSVSIILNKQSENGEKDTYSGGSLTFYGLMDDPKAKHFGFPLLGESGLLVAFRSNTFHEVKPVTRGERYAIVTWYY